MSKFLTPVLTMPKQRKSRTTRTREPVDHNGIRTRRSAAKDVPAAGQAQFSINYKDMPTESLRVMFSQRQLADTGPRRDLIARLQESEASRLNARASFSTIPDNLAAMIATIVEAKLAASNGATRSPPAEENSSRQPSREENRQASSSPATTSRSSPIHLTDSSDEGQHGGQNAQNSSELDGQRDAQPHGFQGTTSGINYNVNLGNPEEVASLHTSYRLPSLASHFSNSTIAAITNGEYVDLASLLPFSTLLPDHAASNLRLQLGNEGLTIPLPSPARRPKITGIDRWLDAFAIYSSVILSSYPSRGVALFAYQQLIRESARKFPGMAWNIYDVEFRHRASHNHSLKWGERDVQLFLDTFTGVPKSILWRQCSSSDHFTDACPLSPRSRDSQDSPRVDLCYNFNKGVPCARTPCPYKHQCNKPGCTGTHPAKDHTDPSSSGSQPKSTSRSGHSSRSRT